MLFGFRDKHSVFRTLNEATVECSLGFDESNLVVQCICDRSVKCFINHDLQVVRKPSR